MKPRSRKPRRKGIKTQTVTATVRHDVMTVEQRSACMSRIRGKDTVPERFMLELLNGAGLKPETQAKDLPGRPDFVLRELSVAIFVDGDFWHGWRFSIWSHKLAPLWKTKIESNRARDIRDHAKHRRAGWKVVRVWEHQIKNDPDNLRKKISRLVAASTHSGGSNQIIPRDN